MNNCAFGRNYRLLKLAFALACLNVALVAGLLIERLT
jgi:hypothetical protein